MFCALDFQVVKTMIGGLGLIYTCEIGTSRIRHDYMRQRLCL